MSQYQGIGGGVRSISCYDDGQQSMFAVCGLDRYLRVFATEPPALLHKVYLHIAKPLLDNFEEISSHSEKETITVAIIRM